jgi:dTDP-4-dehydrorhamnose reductase
MRILVTGASGFIGNACLEAFDTDRIRGTYATRARPGLHHLDLLDREETRRCLRDFRPEAIVHCAARPSVDWCELNPGAARQLNCDTTLNLVTEARSVGARVAFLSTDYVFDGAAGPYDEDAPVRPLNTYGRLKLELEEAILGERRGHVVIRTTNVYGFDLESKNFLMVTLPEIARGREVRVAADQYGTPTLVSDLCRTLRGLLEAGATGVFHVAGPDYVNRLEWAREAAATFGLEPGRIVGIHTASLGQPARRPLRPGLRSKRLGAFNVPVPSPLREGLRQMRDAWTRGERTLE